MERAKVIKEEILEQNTRFLAVYVESTNACLILLSEKEDKLGTLAVAVPPAKDLLGPVSSSVLLGSRNSILARHFAEYLASKKEKIAVVSIYLEKISEVEAQSIFAKLLQKVIQSKAGKEGIST